MLILYIQIFCELIFKLETLRHLNDLSNLYNFSIILLYLSRCLWTSTTQRTRYISYLYRGSLAVLNYQ